MAWTYDWQRLLLEQKQGQNQYIDRIQYNPSGTRSVQKARIIDLICEGEVEGLVDGDKSIKLDNTVLQRVDDVYNFVDTNGDPTVSFQMTAGTSDQAPLEGFPSSESTKNVGSQIIQAVPVIHTITNADVTHARVTLKTPALVN